jgi:MraZ protein
MLFLGTVLNKVDAKGRVSVPSDFRAAVRGDEFQGVILYHSFTQECIEGCTMARLEKLSDATDGLDVFGSEAQNLNSLIFSDARQLAFDVTGRIVIPADLLDFAKISGEAMFVGKGKTFQIWNEAKFKVNQDEERRRATAARPSLKL